MNDIYIVGSGFREVGEDDTLGNFYYPTLESAREALAYWVEERLDAYSQSDFFTQPDDERSITLGLLTLDTNDGEFEQVYRILHNPEDVIGGTVFWAWIKKLGPAIDQPAAP